MEEEKRIKKPLANIIQDENQITINQTVYTLVHNYREAFQLDQLKERYSDILASYDYIVGDIGYDQLRLRGFFYNDNKDAPFEWKIASLEDYLFEYCNFGCPYFVLERRTGEVGKYVKPIKKQHKKPKRQVAHIREKRSKGRKKTIVMKEKGKNNV